MHMYTFIQAILLPCKQKFVGSSPTQCIEFFSNKRVELDNLHYTALLCFREFLFDLSRTYMYMYMYVTYKVVVSKLHMQGLNCNLHYN